MRRLLFSVILLLSFTACGFAQTKKPAAKDPSRVLPPGKVPKDARLGKPRTLRDEYHPWSPPKTLAEWKKERQRIREQVLVSQGLWPLPPKTPLKPGIHGKIDRGDYTVEKVYFQSHPGHYVTGNLYRPKRKAGEPGGVSPRRPGVLCPHGHWRNGRFYDAGEKKAKQQIAKGAEKFMSGARYPVQARMVQLARMGCVVFHYDMVGYADSKPIKHRQGFTDAQAGLRLQNFMGLQTWNSIRALDFLTSLPDVDKDRIGVTGSSGGGTQTFMLCAVDDRPDVAFPAVMVSTGMQGGCVCENASYLRIGINNIALAALFAPKPMALSGAGGDWTREIETKGYPELRQIYGLYGKPGNVEAKAFLKFNHNYNQVAREMMYEWFNRHLKLGRKSPIKERDFKPIPPQELSVWTADHPLPKNAKSAAELREYLTKVSEKQFAKLLPKTKGDVETYRRLVGPAARVMFGDGEERRKFKEQDEQTIQLNKDTLLIKGIFSRWKAGVDTPFVMLRNGKLLFRKRPKVVVDWIDGRGKSVLFTRDGQLKSPLKKLMKEDVALVSRDVILTGEYQNKKTQPPDVNATYAGYTFGYNRPLIVQRVRDVLAMHSNPGSKSKIVLIGSGDAGVWTLLAAAQLGKKVDRVIVDLNGFSFRKLKETSDPNFLPGALKYGGLGGLAALAAPTELVLYGTKGIPQAELAPLIQMYKVTGGKLTLHSGQLTDELIVKEVLGR